MINFLKINRLLHKYLGIIGVLFFVVLSVSGILLMHAESLRLTDKMIDGKYIPDKYFEVKPSGNLRVNTLFASPANRDEIFMGTNLGIFKTATGGKNWIGANQGLYNLDVSVIKADPLDSRILYAGTKNGIFKSTNSGKSWDEWFEETAGLEHTEIADLAIDPANSKKLYAAALDDIFLSEDGGESWVEIFEDTSSKGGRYISSLHILSKDPSILYAGTGSGLIKTDDGGQRWSKSQEKLLNRPVTSFFFSSNNPHTMLIGTDSGLIRSLDNGKTWLLSLPDKSVQAIAGYSEDGKENIIAVTPEELFRSGDYGKTWKNIAKINSRNITINTVHLTGPAKKELWAGTNVGLFSIDDDNNWKHLNLNIVKDKQNSESRKMNLLKLITEIHTGRFFGNYFYWIFDIASVFLIITSITGVYILFFRAAVWQKQKEKIEKLDKVDLIMGFNEKTEEISKDSEGIHGLAEHIKKHLLACKRLSRNGNKNELKEIEGHINSIDEKLHHLMNHIENMSIK